MFRPKEGQYYYRKFRSRWGVWRAGKETDGININQFITDFPTEAEAKEYVYRMNGFNPK